MLWSHGLGLLGTLMPDSSSSSAVCVCVCTERYTRIGREIRLCAAHKCYGRPFVLDRQAGKNQDDLQTLHLHRRCYDASISIGVFITTDLNCRLHSGFGQQQHRQQQQQQASASTKTMLSSQLALSTTTGLQRVLGSRVVSHQAAASLLARPAVVLVRSSSSDPGSSSAVAPPDIKQLAKMAQIGVTDEEVREVAVNSGGCCPLQAHCTTHMQTLRWQ